MCIGGSDYKAIQSSTMVKISTIKSVIRTFNKEGRVIKKHPTGRKRHYDGSIRKAIHQIQDEDASLTLKDIRDQLFERLDWYISFHSYSYTQYNVCVYYSNTKINNNLCLYIVMVMNHR